jgi:hypothetical protein
LPNLPVEVKNATATAAARPRAMLEMIRERWL